MASFRELFGKVFHHWASALFLSSICSGQLVILLVLSLATIVCSQCVDGLDRGDVSCVCNNHTFSCSNAGLTQVPNDVPASVTLINVSHNAIANVEQSSVAKFQQIEVIILTGNQLQQIDTAVFNNLPALRQLYLDGNRLTTLEEIKGVPNLQKIDISRNPINCDEKLKWLSSVEEVIGPACTPDQTLEQFLASLEPKAYSSTPGTKPSPVKDSKKNSTNHYNGHHPSATKVYTVSIVLPILLVALVCTIFVAIIVYRNKQKEAKYNSTVRYSAVQKDRGGGRVYDDVTTEL